MNREKEKMVYVLNVDWNWIKQRPQFIAEYLASYFDIQAIYQYRYKRNGLQKRNSGDINLKAIYVIPGGDRCQCLSMINKKIKHAVVSNEIIHTRPSILYLTLPKQIDLIPNSFKGIIIYDCMDNHPAFISDELERNRLITQEKRLINKSNIVLVSSKKLMSVLVERYGKCIEDKLFLIRNGYNGPIIDMDETKGDSVNELYTFSYFGTIGKWFNFDYLINILNEFSDIKFELYGPVDGIEIPQHERLHYNGTVEHSDLLRTVKNSDCFIMPFVVNDIIKSVDPVKLYEYINFNKNILTCYYNEIDRFEPFVYFYSSYEDFKNQIRLLKTDKKIKYSAKLREDFLKSNSWEYRVCQIVDIIKKYNA